MIDQLRFILVFLIFFSSNSRHWKKVEAQPHDEKLRSGLGGERRTSLVTVPVLFYEKQIGNWTRPGWCSTPLVTCTPSYWTDECIPSRVHAPSGTG